MSPIDKENKNPSHIYNTMMWAPQVPAPTQTVILGHSNHHSQPLNLSFTLLPIPLFSPNLNPYMNEIYTYSQMYDPDDTLLLPKNLNLKDTQNNCIENNRLVPGISILYS